MSESNNSRDLEKRIAATLEAGCARMDPQLVGRLNQARSEALRQPVSARPVRWFGPALAAACLVLVTLMVLPRPPAEPTPVPMTVDLDLLTRPEFEAFLENPDFFAWVAQSRMRKQAQPGGKEDRS